jgi:hypothetical protein
MTKQDLKNLLGTATYQMVRWIEALPVRQMTEFTATLPYDNVATLMACYTPAEMKVHVLCVAYDLNGTPALKYRFYDRDAAVKRMDKSCEMSGHEWHNGFTDAESLLSAVENELAEVDAVTDAPVDERRIIGFDRFKAVFEGTKTVVEQTANYRISVAGGKHELSCIDPDLCSGLRVKSARISADDAKHLIAYMQHGRDVFDEHCAYELSKFQ